MDSSHTFPRVSALWQLPSAPQTPRFAAAAGRAATPFLTAARIFAEIQTKRRIRFEANSVIFRQGDRADSVYYVQRGQIKLSRISGIGREVIVSLLGDGDFLGENCLIGQATRLTTAVSLVDSLLLRLDRDALVKLLRTRPDFAEYFVAYLLGRNTQYEDELENQLCNSAEHRLARCLLLLAHLERTPELARTVPYLSHETLAQIVGTTRARVSQFMHSFRERGLIEYSRQRILVRRSLLTVVLQEFCADTGGLNRRAGHDAA